MKRDIGFALLLGALLRPAALPAQTTQPFVGQFDRAWLEIEGQPQCQRWVLHELRLMLTAHPNPDRQSITGNAFLTRGLVHWQGAQAECALTSMGIATWDLAGAEADGQLPLRMFFGKCTQGDCGWIDTGRFEVQLRPTGNGLLQLSGFPGDHKQVLHAADLPNAAAPVTTPAMAQWTRDLYRQDAAARASLPTEDGRRKSEFVIGQLQGIGSRIVRVARQIEWQDGQLARLEVVEVRGKSGASAGELVVYRLTDDAPTILLYEIATAAPTAASAPIR